MQTPTTSLMPGFAGRSDSFRMAQETRSRDEFRSILARAGAGQDADRAHESARDLVAITFIQPVLRQIRESSGAAAPFAPTQAEKQFGALLDAKLAAQIVESGRFSIVDRIAADLTRASRAVPENARAER